MSISGEQVIMSVPLKEATAASLTCRSGPRTAKFLKANTAEVNLIRYHQLSGFMTDEEMARSERTIKKIQSGQRRYDMDASYQSHADSEERLAMKLSQAFSKIAA